MREHLQQAARGIRAALHRCTHKVRSALWPLQGYRIIEFGEIGPGPICVMMLAVMGAEVVRLERVEADDLGIEREPRHAAHNLPVLPFAAYRSRFSCCLN